MKYILYTIILFTTVATYGQSAQLADGYAEQGEFEKAYAIYNKIYNRNKRNVNVLFRMVELQQQLENYDRADSLLDSGERLALNKSKFPIMRGYNQTLQGKDSVAVIYYNQALKVLDSLPNLAVVTAQQFEQRSLLDQAIAAYERGMAGNEKLNFSFQIARLYGEQGELELMFDNYVDLIERDANYLPRAQAIFSQYITDDPKSTSNQLLRKVLLTRLREQPRLEYNQLLSWLFVQQKDFNAAFIQEKAIYNRDKENILDLQDLAITAYKEKDYDSALNILGYVIDQTQVPQIKFLAQVLELRIKSDRASVDEYSLINEEYISLLDGTSRDGSTFLLQMDYARFLAFKMDQPDAAISLLAALEEQKLGKFQNAETKMLLADILVLQEQFNRALILYSQIQNDLPNSDLAQESQFKVARTSYFQGDFKWSLTQLKVLRDAASKLIANDAMELSLTISDHSLHDTTFVALKAFAKAELKQYQNKNEQAIVMYQSLLQEHKGDPIEDESLLRQAELYESVGKYQQARENYQIIIDNYSTGILADDALYQLGILYQEQLQLLDMAQQTFEKIIYNHADSIHFIDARRRYRRLRGDFEDTES